ncbi:MAG: MFS transporter [Defluviicoccus sp.]|nr:MFS transporter [Defluviicoccus sp.]MDE0386782.1 MFS transporter [Defluviicoccus sp.]
MPRASWLGGIGTALGHRDYRVYSIGASGSFLGTWIYRTALGWLAWELTRSPAWLGIVVFCEVVPIIALVPLTGAATDRLGAYRIFRAAQASGACVMAVLAIATALDAITIELLLALTVLNGVNMAFMQPSFFALVANLVPREALSSAIALQSSMVQTARFIGPAIAGALLLWQGAAAAFAVNAVSYLGMVAALLAIAYRDPGRPAGPAGGLLGDVAQGLRYIAGHETIRTLLVMTVAFSVLLRPVVELLPAFASEVFGRGADGLATLLSSAGAGAIVGSLVIARRGRTQGLTRLLGASGVLCGIAVAGFAATDAFWLAIVLMATYGLLSNANSICSQILIQNCVDPAMRARVMSLVGLTFRSVPAASAALFGGLAALFALGPPIAVAALLGTLVGLWTLSSIRSARLDERAEGPPAG